MPFRKLETHILYHITSKALFVVWLFQTTMDYSKILHRCSIGALGFMPYLSLGVSEFGSSGALKNELYIREKKLSCSRLIRSSMKIVNGFLVDFIPGRVSGLLYDSDLDGLTEHRLSYRYGDNGQLLSRAYDRGNDGTVDSEWLFQFEEGKCLDSHRILLTKNYCFEAASGSMP